jgi:hypothetical protein
MTARSVRVAAAAAFFLYALFIRTFDIADTFLMLGEQSRDWAIALGGLSELPLTGAPSTAGGRGFGPVYYWILWLGRLIVGPFTDNLPHAGGFTVALLQSGAETWLLLALWARVGALLALAMCLLIASAPFDVAISSVIWNPPVAAALVKMATAMALGLGDPAPRWKVAVTAALAWCAVQAHLSAIFVAAPLLAALVVQAGLGKAGLKSGPTLATAAAVAGVILVLQIPYFVAVLRDPAAPMGPTSAITAMANADAIRLDRSYASIVNGTGEVLVRQFDAWRFQIPTAIAAAIVLARWWRDVVLLAVSVGGLAGATVLFATWTRGYDSYWFLTLTPAMVLTYGMAIAAIPRPPVVHWTGAALLGALLLLQPSRVAQSNAFFKYPQYRIMRVASYELAATAPVLRDIRLTFEAHPTMDKYFIYRILGGRIDPAAPLRGFVNADGSVSLAP